MNQLNFIFLFALLAIFSNANTYLHCDGENCRCWNSTQNTIPIPISDRMPPEDLEIPYSGELIPLHAYNEASDLLDFCYSSCNQPRSECNQNFCEDLRNICYEFYDGTDDLPWCIVEVGNFCGVYIKYSDNGKKYFNTRQLENCVCHLR